MVASGLPIFVLDWAVVPFLSGLRLSAGVEQGMVNLANDFDTVKRPTSML
jgi:hypothetical protein